MKKKIILGLVAVVAVAGGVAVLSAYEAHVINVTARIENALSVAVEHIDFGTVFPQEYLEFPLEIALSGSFLAEDRVDDVEYVIKQKPKPMPITAPTIDGVIDAGEWDEASVVTVANGKGTVSMMADTNYLYAAFDILDSTDARLGQNTSGNDQQGLNINPGPGPWGKPYDIVFQTGADACAFTTPVPDNPCVSSGLSDGWQTEWVINGTQVMSLPGDLETKTLFGGGRRVSEWKIPLASIAPEAGDELKIGGAANVDGTYNPYPVGLDWNDVNTFYVLLIPAYPDLCAYLSKTPDGTPDNDTGVPAFHDPGQVAIGRLAESEQDIIDNWIIDLNVPCFEGMCAQDWTHYGWELDPELESQIFGCDLWIEVTGISEWID
ncbi:MAG TPA: hypothetical protein ENI19_02650 [Candidatus Nealsonbacteria bacterium]|uniref:Uncharacterized protein n=1 Tax=marine sediment metagenome TaxID=412755 RepID=A0A0F9U317_9ZZZZ|nr:hypothetical protein [Candidatus Nealsonbacteria bacterium]HEB46586.1 hypothetical protein [Candidatus Nealsonbacteria bacterium]